MINVIFVVSVKAGKPSVYELEDMLANSLVHSWKILCFKEPKITATDKENGGRCDVLLRWKQQETGKVSGLWCIKWLLLEVIDLHLISVFLSNSNT